MNSSPSKNDDILDKTIEENSLYCKDVVPILVKNASNYSMFEKVTGQLGIERFKGEHSKMDEKIAAFLKKAEKTHKTAGELDHQIYIANQTKNQTKVRFKSTKEIIHVLREEAEKLQARTKKIETKRLEITKKVTNLAEQRDKIVKSKIKIEDLEREMKKILEAPEPLPDGKLIKEDEELKKLLEEKQKKIVIKLKKKNKIADLKEQRLNLLLKINTRQEENKVIREEIRQEKDIREKVHKEMEQKFNDIEKKIKNEIIMESAFSQNLIDLTKNCEEKQLEMEELKINISLKEKELEDMKAKTAVQKEYIKEENKRQQQELENLKENLLYFEKILQDAMDEKAQKIDTFKRKTDTFGTLKVKKEELTVRLYDQKLKLLTRQYGNSEHESKIHVLSEKLCNEQQNVESLKIKNEELEKTQKEIEKNLEEFPKESEEKCKEIELNHKEQIEVLLKQKNFRTATVETIQNHLDHCLKEVEKFNKEVKDLEESNSWSETKLEARKKHLNTLKESVTKEQVAYEKLLAQTKQKESDYKTIEAEKTKEITENMSTTANKSNGILKSKNAFMVPQQCETMEVNENEENVSLSGRKSPGILKTLKEPKRPQTPTKRVTFEGLSSTESSSASVDVAKNVEEEAMDEFLKDWGNTSYASSNRTKKRPMDF